MTPSPARGINVEQNGNSTEIQYRSVTYDLSYLRPHPSYVKHGLSVSKSRLATLAAASDFAFLVPIVVTRTGIIIDGYARCELARQQGRRSIACLEYDLSEEEALRWLIHSHAPSKGLNDYCRSILALDLEASLHGRSRVNQQIGGQSKASSHLTEAQKMDVRSEIAATAKVSTGSLTKVKHVVAHTDAAVQEAAKSGEIRIHRAYQWKHLSRHEQLRKLEEFRSCKGVGLVSRRLIQKHVDSMRPTQLIPPTLGDIVKPLIHDYMALLDTIVVSEIDVQGQVAYLTTDAMRLLRSRRNPECETATC